MNSEETSTTYFPEGEFNGVGDLENIFLQAIKEGKPIIPEQLPDTLSSVGIERYINWVADQAKKDPQGREYAGELHIDVNGKFIYSKRLNKGTETSVSPRASRNLSKFIRAVFVHTHPDSTSFSNGDLLGINSTLVQALATSEFNYILLRNPEELIAEDQEEQFNAESNESLSEWASSIGGLRGSIVGAVLREANLSLNQPQLQMVQPALVDLVKQMEINTFGTDLTRYMHTLNFAMLTANKYGLGFYYSKKDGMYIRVDQIFIDNITTRVNEELVERLHQQLPNQLKSLMS